MKHVVCRASGSWVIVLLVILLGGASPAVSQVLPQVKKVFVIAMENHNFTQPSPTSSPQQILGNAAAPYINSLITPGNSNAAQVSYCTQCYNAGVGVHPSEPNYVWAEAGTDFGVHTDNDPSSGSGNIFTAPHLTAQLDTAGIAWKNYQEDVQLSSGPKVSASGTSGTVINPYYSTGQYNYGAKHNPMVFFSDTQIQNVYPLTQFATDLGNHALGRYNWITPNQYNDQHSALTGGFAYHGTAYTGDQAAVAQGDNFLSILVPRIMATTEYQDHGVIIIRWDETEGGDSTSYTIPLIVISPLAKGNAYASSLEMSHSSVLKTAEEIFGLSYLANAIPAGETKASGSGYNAVASANDLLDLFQPVPGIVVQQPAGASLTNGVSTSVFGAVNLGQSGTNVFTITNAGNATLTLSNLVVAGANSADFTVSGITLPASVAPGGKTTFAIAYSPAVCGAGSATLQITNNDSSRDPFTVALAGSGNALPVIAWSFTNLTLNAGSNCAAAMIDVTGTNFVLATDACAGTALSITQMPAVNTPLVAGSTNLVLIAVSDGVGNTAYSTNWIWVADVTPPVITGQPQSQTVAAGSGAIFSVTATACTPLSYQWYFGTNLLAGGTDSEFNLASVSFGDAGDYHVVVTSAGGSTSSDIADLQVGPGAPVLIRGQLLGNGVFQLLFTGPPGQTYSVVATDDLTVSTPTWSVLGAGTFDTNTDQFTDHDSSNRLVRFYRIKSP